MNRLDRHINRYLDTIYSRRGLTIERLEWNIRPNSGFITARLRFWDNSLLEFDETLMLELDMILKKISFAFHYQDANNRLILRYDNAPHHPEISTHPHHKHIGERIEASEAPDLSDVLREIDRILSAGERDVQESLGRQSR